MFNKALKNQRKEELKLLKEYKKSLKQNYNGYDIGMIKPKIRKYNDVDYRIEPAWRLMVDDYDETIDAVELSHKQGLGFSIINSYSSNAIDLDFRFAEVQDIIDIKLNSVIQKIHLNSSNIRYAFFKGDCDIKYDITIDTDIVDFIISLKQFLDNNIYTVESINFQNANALTARIASKICFENNVGVVTFINDKKDKIKVHKK